MADPESSTAPPAAELLSSYAPTAERFDLLGRGAAAGGPWRPLLEELARHDGEARQRRLATARRLIRENGVTYNVYDEAGGEARPWELDTLPLVIDAATWQQIETGLVQRARLADALLADVYGEQRLSAQGCLPPHLVVGHPQFLRPLCDIVPPGGVRVHLHALDLTRAPDGRWSVLAERADAPAGVGYALENRIVVSQLYPELFRDLGVRRVASFFQGFRDGVLGLAAAAQPRGVLLTPGPHNEAYFEHAYLARYLGLALVEGDDLAVRDGGVFLKTLAGLERIDVIVRRVDSDFSDPIVFRADSALGVPGLAEAARSGQVVIANALGGGLIGSPGLAAYLPGLCRALLGEELLLASERSLWCGTEAGRRAVLADLESLVVRDAFDQRPLFARGSSARLGSEMSRAERARLATLMSRRGATLAAQELVPLAAAPVQEGDRLVARPVVLRCFVAWTPEGWLAMPGGLTRVGADAAARAVTMQSGGATKDTWVLSDEPVEGLTLLRSGSEPLAIRRVGEEAPSRAMDNLFWLGRYAERAEQRVRLQRAAIRRLGDDAGLGAATTVAAFARRALVPLTLVGEAAAKAAAAGDLQPLTEELMASIFGRDNPHGLRRVLDRVQRTAWAVRDRLSLDTWRSVISLVGGEGLPGTDRDLGAAQSYLDGIVRRTAALAGLAAENLARGRNRLFLELGRRVERAANHCWLLRQLLVVPEDPEEEALQLLLEIADSAMTYRYRYLGVFQAAPVIDLLALDESNPRSVAYQVEQLKTLVGELPRGNLAQAEGQDRRLAATLVARIAAADPLRLARRDDSGRRPALAELLELVEGNALQLSDVIGRAYFRHSASRRTGSAPRGESA